MAIRRKFGRGDTETNQARTQAPGQATAAASRRRLIRVEVNGQEHEREVDVRRSLGDFLREDLDLTATHFGCEHGVCGACTVQVDGEAVRSCLMLAVQAHGSRVKTLEGMSPGGGLGVIQQAFWDHKGQQCGFCTPGMLLATEDFLRGNPSPTRQEVREGMSGNICRCTGYQFIVDSIMAAAEELRQSNEDPTPTPDGH